MAQDWSTLEKGDKLYLMIPYNDDGIIKYEFQESQVINVHQYDWCTNVRFKYTDLNINKRRRVELCVNKYKYKQTYLACCEETSWARDYYPKWGDIIVIHENPEYINEIYNWLIEDKIREQEALIESQQSFLEKLKDIQFNIII